MKLEEHKKIVNTLEEATDILTDTQYLEKRIKNFQKVLKKMVNNTKITSK